jgi:hypothetical protein
MSTYWVLTQPVLSNPRKKQLRLLGLDARPRFNSDTFVGRLTATQAERLKAESWVLSVEKDAGTLKSLTDEDEEMRKERKLYVRTLLTHGSAMVPGTNSGVAGPAAVTHAVIGYEADGTAIVVRRRFSAV